MRAHHARLTSSLLPLALSLLAAGCAVDATESQSSSGGAYSSIGFPPACTLDSVATPPAQYYDGYSALEPSGRRIAVVSAGDLVKDAYGSMLYDFVFVDVDLGTVVQRQLVTDAQYENFMNANPAHQAVPSGGVTPTNPPPPPPPVYKDLPPSCVPGSVVRDAQHYYFAPPPPPPPPPPRHRPPVPLPLF